MGWRGERERLRRREINLLHPFLSLIKTLARPAPTPGAVLSRNGSRLVRGAGDGCFTKRTRKRVEGPLGEGVLEGGTRASLTTSVPPLPAQCRSRPATGLILSLPLLGAALLTVLEGGSGMKNLGACDVEV